MLAVSLCQLRYLQMKISLFSVFAGVQVSRCHSLDMAGYIASVGYIREPREILNLCHLPPQMVHIL